MIRYSAAGGVVIHAGRMLLLDRPTRNEVRLPKGHIDEGEQAEAAALRETQEEAGYADLSIVESLGSQIVEFDSRGEHFIRTEYYFLMRLESEARLSRPAEDEAQFRPMWVDVDKAVAQLTYDAEKEMARRAIRLFQQA